jgi:hypothetical protein
VAKKQSDDLFEILRGRGLRKRVARTIADLDGGGRKAGSRGEKLARKAAADLTAAAEDIRKRVLGGESSRGEAARKAALTRKRAAAKRSASAKKGARTRARAKS